MATLRRRTLGKQTYIYIVQNRRRGGKVQQVILEYLGNARDVMPERLKRALVYWQVGKGRKGKGGRR